MAEIEAACARLAAMSMTPIERRRLQNLHESMAALARRGERDDYAAANVAFHTCVYSGAHNEILAEFAGGLRRRLAPFRRAQFRAEGRLARSHAEHAAVVQAILACDAAAAHAAMFHHMSLVEDSSASSARRRGRARKRGRTKGRRPPHHRNRFTQLLANVILPLKGIESNVNGIFSLCLLGIANNSAIRFSIVL